MKKFITITALVTVLTALSTLVPSKVWAQDGSVSFQIFYDQLSPHGSWVDYQNYGYVWIPNLGEDFTPYSTAGHWVLTDEGWTWASDYSWGWAPFHYGRWAHDDSYGWLWIPGNEWGPAWVSWRRSPGYYGWAPMGPGVSLEVSFGSGYRVPNNEWTFVGDRDFGRNDMDRRYVNRTTNIAIINNSTVVNNSYTDNGRHVKYVAGPARDEVQKSTGLTVRPVTIREEGKPGGASETHGQLNMYRPQVGSSESSGRKPAPSQPVALKDVKHVSERKAVDAPHNDPPPEKRNTEAAPADAPKVRTHQVDEQVKPKAEAPAQSAPVAKPNDNSGPPHEPTMVRTTKSRSPSRHVKAVPTPSPTVTHTPAQQPEMVKSPKTYQNIRTPKAPKRARQTPNPAGNNRTIHHAPTPNTEKHTPDSSKATSNQANMPGPSQND